MGQGPTSAGEVEAPRNVSRLVFRAGLSLVLVAVGFALIAFGLAAEDIRPAFEAIASQTLLLLILLSAINYLARTGRWLLLFRAINRRGSGRALADVPLQGLVYMGGFAFTLTPGRAGEAIRVWTARRSFGTPADAGLSLVVADRFYDAVALTVILTITGLALSRDVMAPLVLSLVLAASIAFLGWSSAAHPVWAKLGRRAPWLARTVGLVEGTIGHLAVVSRPKRLPVFALPSIAGWTIQGLAPALILSDLGVSLSATETIFIFAFATLVGGLSFLPGGLGGFEVTMVALLTAMDVPVSTALVATLAMRLTTLWFGVLLGMAALCAWLVLQGRRG